MKRFYGSTFIEKEKLKEAGIEDKIKLEYYKIINEEELTKGTNSKYGIKVIKTQYAENDIQTEDKTIKYLSNNEEKVDEILKILKDNEVTPVCVQEIICDLSKSAYLL